MKKTFSKDVREAVRRGQEGYCETCTNSIEDFHHRLANTKVNNKLYPRLIQSIFNCVGLCRWCHEKYSHQYNITEGMAMVYEQWLKMEGVEGLKK